MDTVVMKIYSRYDMRYIIDCWNLDISEFRKIFYFAQIVCPVFLPSFFAQMFPFGIFICIDDPVRTSDVFGGGSDMTSHDVAISLALIGLKIHRIFARRTHTLDTGTYTKEKGSPGSAPLYSRHRPQLPGPKIFR